MYEYRYDVDVTSDHKLQMALQGDAAHMFNGATNISDQRGRMVTLKS
jgi:hypothetical protein